MLTTQSGCQKRKCTESEEYPILCSWMGEAGNWAQQWGAFPNRCVTATCALSGTVMNSHTRLAIPGALDLLSSELHKHCPCLTWNLFTKTVVAGVGRERAGTCERRAFAIYTGLWGSVIPECSRPAARSTAPTCPAEPRLTDRAVLMVRFMSHFANRFVWQPNFVEHDLPEEA